MEDNISKRLRNLMENVENYPPEKRAKLLNDITLALSQYWKLDEKINRLERQMSKYISQ